MTLSRKQLKIFAFAATIGLGLGFSHAAKADWHDQGGWGGDGGGWHHEDHWDHGGQWGGPGGGPDCWHHGWDRGYYAPPPVYYAPPPVYYAPPPPVYVVPPQGYYYAPGY